MISHDDDGAKLAADFSVFLSQIYGTSFDAVSISCFFLQVDSLSHHQQHRR